MAKEKTEVGVYVDMPASLHKQLKIVAIERDTTIKALLIGCAQSIVEKQSDRTTEDRTHYDPKG